MTQRVEMVQRSDDGYDVVVVGGGAAGLSAAVTLGRARRSVLVVDAGRPRNAAASGVHGFLSRDGLPPAELGRAGRAEAEAYGATIRSGTVVGARRAGDGFEVTLADGGRARGRRLLVTCGLVDELPQVPGLRERWGRDVVHCPYCHGWEVRDQRIGVLSTGPTAVHQALLFRQLSASVTLFLHTGPEPSAEQWEQLAARGIGVVDGVVDALSVADDRLRGVVLRDGSAAGRLVPVQALAVAPEFVAASALLVGLGARHTGHPPLSGEFVEVDATGQTSVAGVWAAGNVADPKAQVVVAAAAGLSAAAAINSDLVMEELADAVRARRAPFSAAAEARNTDTVLGERRHGLERTI